jgi:predicted PurR-regulated permease PerM
MKMNPFLVFIGIIGGIKLFGILGIVYGPLIITIFLTLAEIYRLEYKTVEVV